VDPTSPGVCSGLSFVNDPTFSAAPTVSGANVTLADNVGPGLLTGYCYEWQVLVTDNVGNSKTYTSRPVLRDTSIPAVPSVVASGSGVYQASANGPVYVNATTAGSLTLTSTGSGSTSGIGSSTFGMTKSQVTGWSLTRPRS
jgi:hypothetical protein